MSYAAKDLVVLEGLDAVRMRPGMYVGSTGSRGMHHILWEIIDNGIDELANGYGNTLTVKIHKDGSATVSDNGRGVPVDPHPKLKISGVEVVYTQLHAGGKFGDGNYQYSGGLHGVGASVTNALSRYLEVTVCREGKKYYAKFESIQKGNKIHSGQTVQKLTCLGDTKETGTTVHFMPDDRVFSDVDFSYDAIAKKLREDAYLNRGIIISFTDERTGQKEQFCYEGGIKDYVTYLNEGKTAQYYPPVFIEGESDGVYVQLALQHTDTFTENIFSFVNNIPTPEGGWHEVGFKTALTKVLNDTARKQGFIKEKEDNLLGEDYREGMTAVLCIKMKNVQFEGQTKTKLGNVEAKTKVEAVCSVKLDEFFNSIKNTPILQAIIEKAKGAQKVRLASRRAKDLARAKNSIEGSSLVGKFANCSGRDYSKNELFIVEGKSAGGNAKMGRDRHFQAILPLRGKPLNAEKKRMDQVLQNEEIRTIIGALGTGIGDDFKISNLKFDKVIILSDADVDGEHIRAILITFFFRYMRELITDGHVYCGMPPLYKVTSKDKSLYAYNDKDLQDVIAQVGKNYTLQRYKGLGEMNADQLKETTMNPAKRSLIQVTIDDAVQADQSITTWMGDAVEKRKEYITK
ncbi:MAG: DNA gyrase subunit B, partial [Clostridia bacterium]|nr:DNA gyrase subunit B [Clostridia bacterium]